MMLPIETMEDENKEYVKQRFTKALLLGSGRRKRILWKEGEEELLV